MLRHCSLKSRKQEETVYRFVGETSETCKKVPGSIEKKKQIKPETHVVGCWDAFFHQLFCPQSKPHSEKSVHSCCYHYYHQKKPIRCRCRVSRLSEVVRNTKLLEPKQKAVKDIDEREAVFEGLTMIIKNERPAKMMLVRKIPVYADRDIHVEPKRGNPSPAIEKKNRWSKLVSLWIERMCYGMVRLWFEGFWLLADGLHHCQVWTDPPEHSPLETQMLFRKGDEIGAKVSYMIERGLLVKKRLRIARLVEGYEYTSSSNER